MDLVRQLGIYSVRELLREGLLVRYGKNVVIDRTRQLDLRTRASAALLYVGPRAALTGHTAAFLHGCTAADAGTVHVLSSYDRKELARPGLALHQGCYAETDVLELDGLRTVALEIVIAELLCTAHRPTALACVDQALAAVDSAFGTHSARRSPNASAPAPIRAARAELGCSSASPPACRSPLLRVACSWALYDAGLPLPELQFSVLDLAGRERYRLDFAWAEPRVALEYDGYEAHEDRAGYDGARDADLRSRGWMVVRATASDLRKPASLVHALRAAFARRRYVA